MEVQRFLVGPLNTNCYLVQEKKTKEKPATKAKEKKK